MMLPTQGTIEKYQRLLDKFDDPDGCIDDSEELLEEVPTYLEFIIALHYELISVRNQLAATRPV